MPASVLVAYSTRYGSTQDVAKAVADALRGHQIPADLQPARGVRSLEA